MLTLVNKSISVEREGTAFKEVHDLKIVSPETSFYRQ